jgi:prevent-host-death family protein
MQVIGVREARQHLSRYLERVQAGESFTVTDHGRPVAVLGPPPRSDDPLAGLVLRGLADPPREPYRPPVPVRLPDGPAVADLLEEQREDRL